MNYKTQTKSRRKSNANARKKPTAADRRTRAKAEKRSRTKRRFLIAIAVIVVLVILAVAGLGVAYLLTDNFGRNTDAVVLTYDGKTYTRVGEGLTVTPDSEFIVQSVGTKEPEYTVKIVANDGGDFAFKLGAEEYKWSDMKGRDCTKGFTITKTKEGFTVSFYSLKAIVEAVQGDVTMDETTKAEGDLFEMIIENGDREIRLKFGIDVVVTDVQLEPGQVVV